MSKVISKKNLDILIDMGFEVTYQKDDFMMLYNAEYDFGVDLFLADKRDTYKGVYMNITVDGKSINKDLKGRNIISNTKRYIEQKKKFLQEMNRR